MIYTPIKLKSGVQIAYLAEDNDRRRRNRARIAKSDKPPLIPAPMANPFTEAVKILHRLS